MNSHETNKTRRLLRTKGTMRRRMGLAVRINSDAAGAILAPIYEALPKTMATAHHNLTYGEIEWGALKRIAEYAEKQSGCSGTKFYDLGSGRGRAVLYMSLAGSFEQSVGIEILGERVKLSQEALQKLKLSIPTAGSKLRIYEASFLNPAFKYKDAKVIYVANLCFDKQTQDALFAKLSAEMPKGSLLFCSVLPDTLPGAFQAVATEPLPMSWIKESDVHVLRHL